MTINCYLTIIIYHHHIDASCDPDTERFNCLVDPCDNAYCPNLPDANCLPDYCGGCSARFYDTFGVEVTDTCSKKCNVLLLLYY